MSANIQRSMWSPRNILNKSQKGENELQEHFNTLLNPTKTCSIEETALP